MSHSLKSDIVKNGRRKSLWSICGGMRSPSSYIFTIQLSGTQLPGNTCHLTKRCMAFINRLGMGSTVTSCVIQGDCCICPTVDEIFVSNKYKK